VDQNTIITDNWSRNWDASVAVKITSATLWAIVIAAFIYIIVVLKDADKQFEQQIDKEANHIAYSIAIKLDGNSISNINSDWLKTNLNNKITYLELLSDNKQVRAGKKNEIDIKITRTIPFFSTAHHTYNLQLKLHHIPINTLVHNHRKEILIVITLLLTCYGFFHVIIIGWILQKPFKILEDTTQQVMNGDLSVRMDNHRKDEFGRIGDFFNNMLDGIQKDKEHLSKTNQELKHYGEQLESMVHARTIELETQKAELANSNKILATTLSDLEESQHQLILSEKMASLGQLVAGIAHEINTPAGAIYSAIHEVHHSYTTLLTNLIQILSLLPSELKPLYYELCHKTLVLEKNNSTKEQRNIAREIKKIFYNYKIDDAHSLSKDISLIGLNQTDIIHFIKLFEHDNCEQIIQSIKLLGMNQIHVRDIEIAIDRITHLVKALKSYSHIDKAKRSSTDLIEDMETTLIILHNKLKQGVIIHKDFDDIPRLNCYPDKLNQVWTNLIHNAIQAMNSRGTINLRIKQPNKTTITVEIEDNGPGIPDDIIDHIFEPHFTTKQKGEGTGLGLAITKTIIDEHDGNIEVTSQPECTCFKITLPLIFKVDL
jgi:signal transduction histidine kinase